MDLRISWSVGLTWSSSPYSYIMEWSPSQTSLSCFPELGTTQPYIVQPQLDPLWERAAFITICRLGILDGQVAWTPFTSGQTAWRSFTRRRIVAGSLDVIAIPGRWLGHHQSRTLGTGKRLGRRWYSQEMARTSSEPFVILIVITVTQPIWMPYCQLILYDFISR